MEIEDGRLLTRRRPTLLAGLHLHRRASNDVSARARAPALGSQLIKLISTAMCAHVASQLAKTNVKSQLATFVLVKHHKCWNLYDVSEFWTCGSSSPIFLDLPFLLDATAIG